MSDSDIKTLKAKNEELLTELEYYKSRAKRAENALKKAESTAEEILRKAEKLYNTEGDRLRLFKRQWDNVYKKYVLSGKEEELSLIADEIDEIFSSSSGDRIERIDRARRLLQTVEEEVVFGEGDLAFSLDDIQNPKDIDMEELAKELGLK